MPRGAMRRGRHGLPTRISTLGTINLTVASHDYVAALPLARADGGAVGSWRRQLHSHADLGGLMGRIRDLRIGTKLAATSGLTFLLIAGIIFTQMSANAGI